MPVEQLVTNGATIQSSVLYYGSPTATTGTADAGVTVSLLNATAQVVATTVTDANGAFSFGNLAAGTYQLQYTPPGRQTFDPAGLATGLTAPLTVAAGQTVTAPAGAMVPLASIDGTVLLNGTGEAGVTVSVLTAAGTLVATATTNSTGGFAFTDLLAAGSYEVKYTAPSGQVLETGSEASATTGLTPAVTLATSQVLTLPSELLLSDPVTVRATALHYGAPTDASWGTGEGGVTVSLLNAAGQVIAAGVTNSSGTFAFADLPDGIYQLQYGIPSGQGFKSGVPEDASTGLTAQFVVTGDGTYIGPAAGYVSNTVSGLVQLSGVAEAGVAVSLLTASGTLVASTTTSSTGAFSFSGMAAGSYQVQYTAPSGQVLAAGSAADTSTGLTTAFAVSAGAAISLPTEQLAVAPATIRATALHYGAPTDASWGTGEAGVTVALLNAASAVLATAVTNTSGVASFGQLAAGTYQLKYTAPAGQGFLPGGPENPATGLTAQFTVAAGQSVWRPPATSSRRLS